MFGSFTEPFNCNTWKCALNFKQSIIWQLSRIHSKPNKVFVVAEAVHGIHGHRSMTKVILQLHERAAIFPTGVLQELVIRILLYADITNYLRQTKLSPTIFAIFSATFGNFCMKFYMFMWLSYVHLNAKQQLTSLNRQSYRYFSVTTYRYVHIEKHLHNVPW